MLVASSGLIGPMLVAASPVAAAAPGADECDTHQSAAWWGGLRQLDAYNAQHMLAVQACDGAVAAAWAALGAAVPSAPAAGAPAAAAVFAPPAVPAGAGEDPLGVAAPADDAAPPEALLLQLGVPAPAAVLPDGPVAPGGGGAVPPLAAGADAAGVQPGAGPVLLRGQVVEHVDHFVYLGSVVTADNSLDRDINRRLSRAAYAFQTLQPVLRNRHLSARTKCTLYRAIVVNNLVYGSEAWVPKASQMRRLDVFHLRCLRHILGVSRLDHVPNSAILQKAKTDFIDVVARRYRLRWLGHVGRMRSTTQLPDAWPLAVGPVPSADPVCLAGWPSAGGSSSHALGPAGRW